MKNKKYRSGYKTNSKKPALLVIIALVVLGSLFWWFLLRNDSKPTTTTTEINESSEDVDYSPPSEEENVDNDRVKDEVSNQNDTPTTTSTNNSGTKSVDVVITNWGQSDSMTKFEVGAYAQVLESSGKCKLTMKKGSVSLSGNSTATQNPTTMSCGALSVDYSKVTPGTWTATVKYVSTKSEGTATKQITVE